MGTYSTSAAAAALAAGRDAALAAVCALANGGTLRIYDGTAPANAQTALSGNTLLAQATFASPAFGTPSSAVATANAITADASADATGTPTFFRILSSAAAVIYQGTAGASGQELNLSGLTGGQIIAAAPVSISSLTISQPGTIA